MSALLSDLTALIPLAVLGASLLGSFHCTLMCGGIAAAAGGETRGARIAYHLGRLAGYLLLGTLAGLFGETLLTADFAGGLIPWAAALGLGLILILLGVRLWRGGVAGLSGPHILKRWISGPLGRALRIRSSATLRGGLIGGLTAFLPCGWLYTYVLAALASGHPFTGALILTAFWLGTVPYLAAAPLLVQRLLSPLTRRSPRAAASVLIFAGIITLGVKLLPLLKSGESAIHSCH